MISCDGWKGFVRWCGWVSRRVSRRLSIMRHRVSSFLVRHWLHMWGVGPRAIMNA